MRNLKSYLDLSPDKCPVSHSKNISERRIKRCIEFFMNPAVLLLFLFVASHTSSEGNSTRRKTVRLSLSKACKRCFDKLHITAYPTFICQYVSLMYMGLYD